ncbi:hypothetical protein [Paraburkholderia sp. J41]|uniref:hypothetical protein n=1 Tax=Paraburkholderia sp. J41 TaxID=2805433 RepID=UPI002AC34C4B|nr:hypothetical protein [Paraburkholderia sp. J41]
MTWNTLDVPLENGWQCTLIPGLQYYDLTAWGRGYRNTSARQLYPNAGRDNSAYSRNARPLSDVDKSELWEKDRIKQLADDRAAFARHFRPNWDLRTITGEKALRDVQAFVRGRLNLAHWNLPTDNAAVKKILTDAVASGQLVPVVNREYRGVPRVAPPAYAPQRWPATGGGGGYPPKVHTYLEFEALKRANGEIPPMGATAVSATLNPQPDLGVPARSDDGFGLLGFVEAAAGVLLGNDDSDGGDDAPDLAESMADDSAEGDVPDDSTPLGDAQPFDYQPDMPDGDGESLAGMPIVGGPPNTWVENPSGSGQLRFYDANGNAASDLDFDHDHGFGIPHAHNWDGRTRDLGNPVSLLPY